METEEQLLKFLVWVAFGIGCGIGADGYRSWSQTIFRTKSFVWSDCGIWCVFAICVFLFSLYLREGEMRFYFFLGLGGGYVLYRRIFGDRVMRIWVGAITVTQKIARGGRRVVRMMIMPICFLTGSVGSAKRIVQRWFAKREDLPPTEKR